MKRISIAMCTFNGESFVEEQLRSFEQQTRLPDELIVSDDGSTDKTIELVEDFGSRAPFPVVLKKNQSNVGFAKNFERALLACSMEVIFPSDQDDVWMPEKIESHMRAFEEDPEVGIVCSDAALVDSGLEPLEKTLWQMFSLEGRSHSQLVEEGLRPLLFDRNYISGATSSVRSDIVDLLRDYPIPAGMPHDRWLGILALIISKPVFIAEPLIKYRQHGGQMIGTNGRTLSDSSRRRRSERFAQQAVESESQSKSIRALCEFVDGPETNFIESTELLSLLNSAAQRLKDRADHFASRANMARSLSDRLKSIAREIKLGRYTRFSNGYKSAATDLLLLHRDY